MRVDPTTAAAFSALVAFMVTYVAFGGRFPPFRTPFRMIAAGILAFFVGFAVLSVLVAAQAR